MEFVRDCLDRNMSMLDIATKYGIEIEDIVPTYYMYKEKYTQEQIDATMEEVYYNVR